MNTRERNRRIYEIRKSHPNWPYRTIGELVGLSRQRVHQIVQQAEAHGIMATEMEPRNNYRLDNKPISATQAARLTGIPYGVISMWVFRGLVKVVEHPSRGGRRNPVLLDPVSLQERIDGYQPRPRRNCLDGKPISATEVSRLTGIPRWVIEKWIQRGLVKVIERPSHTAPGKPVLLDPVSLQERIDRYRPWARRDRVAV